MTITDCISEKCIVPDFHAEDRAEAIAKLVDILEEQGLIPDSEEALRCTLQRESIGSTEIGHGVAIPHATVCGLKGLVCAVGRSRSGVNFHSSDGERVHVIFLVLFPPIARSAYLRFVASLAKFALSKPMLQSLIEADTTRGFYRILSEAEGGESGGS